MTKKDISKHYTEENITRLIAFQVVIILLITFLTNQTYLIFFLTVDFAIRAFTYWSSPLRAVAKAVSNLLKLKPKPIFVAPKKFAAAVGFLFSLAISILVLSGLITTAYVVGGILALFAFLEATLGICVGCYVYNWLIAPIINKQQ